MVPTCSHYSTIEYNYSYTISLDFCCIDRAIIGCVIRGIKVLRVHIHKKFIIFELVVHLHEMMADECDDLGGIWYNKEREYHWTIVEVRSRPCTNRSAYHRDWCLWSSLQSVFSIFWTHRTHLFQCGFCLTHLIDFELTLNLTNNLKAKVATNEITSVRTKRWKTPGKTTVTWKLTTKSQWVTPILI